MVGTAKPVQLAESVRCSRVTLPWKTAMARLMAVSLAVAGMGWAGNAKSERRAAASEPPRQEKPHTDRYGDPLPNGALARLGTVRFRQGFLTRQVAFSPDGKIIACAAAGRGVCLWDASTGKELRQIGRATHAASLAFSPDGKRLVCVFDSRNTGTGVYETDTGEKKIDLPDGIGGYPIGLALSPDGKTIAGGESRTNHVHFFDATTGAKRKAEIRSNKPDDILKMAWSPDSKILAHAGKSGSVHLWDAIHASEIGKWKAHEKAISSVAFSPDGKLLATGGMDETIRLWDVATHKELHVLDGKNRYVRVVTFSHDGRMLAAGHGDGAIALWEVEKGKELLRWKSHGFMVSSLDFSPDDKVLASGAIWECGPRLWDVATGAEVRAFAGHTAPVERLLFSPDGKRIQSLGREKKILDWDPTNGRETLRFQWPSTAAAGGWDNLILSPRGDVLASWGHEDEVVRLWDTATAKERRALGKFTKSEKSRFFAALDFSLDGRMFAVATKDGDVSIWDVDSGAERQRLKAIAGQALCLAFSHDGQKLAVGSTRGNPTIVLCEVKSGKKLVEFSSTDRVDRLVFSPDDKLLAAVSWGPNASRLWDATTGRAIRPLEAAPGLYDIAFSPDGKWLAGAGEDKDQKVHVWEVNTGRGVRTFRGHISAVSSIAFAPDGRTIASGGSDSSVLLWDFTGRMKDGRLPTVKGTPRELEQRWIDLGGAAPQAVQAIWDFVASPEQSIALLRQRIKPVEPADARRVEQLIRDLDSDDFQTRTKATDELEKIVDGAEPRLRKKLAEKPSLEMRQRIHQVLSKLEPTASAERLRELRAIQVLEYAGTAEARDHLRTLAKGIPDARLTREAKAALERLAK